MEPPIWAWIALIAAVPVLTAVDVLVFARGRHEVSAKAAAALDPRVGRPGARLHRHHRRDPGRDGGRRVHRRLPGRVEPLHRQPVRLRRDLRLLRGAEGHPAAGAAVRGAGGAGLPRHLHRHRRGGPRRRPLGDLRLRRVPALHGLPAGEDLRRAGGPQQEPAAAAGQPLRAQHRRLPRAEGLRPRARPATGHPDLRGAAGRRQHRRGLRGRTRSRPSSPSPTRPSSSWRPTSSPSWACGPPTS